MVWLCQPAPIKIGVPRGRGLSTFARRTYLRLLDDRSYQLPQSANFASRTQPRPRGTLIADQRRACAARPKGKYSRERMALAPIRARRIFPATGAGRQVARATPCFHPIDFYVTHRFFGTFLTQESTVIPVSPRVSPHQNAPGRISAGRNEFALEAAVEGAALTAYARSPRGRTDRPCRPL